MADISITERFGAEPLRCDDCGAPHPEHTKYCPDEGATRRCNILCRALNDVERLERELTEARAAGDRAHDEAQVFLDRETQCRRKLVVAQRERDEARQAADEQAEAARAARLDACLRGFAIARTAFETWRNGDKVIHSVGDDPDVFLALQATHLGFQALARALEKK